MESSTSCEVKNFPKMNLTPRFIALSTRPLHWSLYWARWTPSNLSKVRFNIPIRNNKQWLKFWLTVSVFIILFTKTVASSVRLRVCLWPNVRFLFHELIWKKLSYWSAGLEWYLGSFRRRKICLFVAYFTTLSAARAQQRQTMPWLINEEFKIVWKGEK
jgi:hypothetical protein